MTRTHSTALRNACHTRRSAPYRAANGEMPSARKIMSSAVLFALGAMAAMPALATPGCYMWGPNTISTTLSSTCVLGSGSSLEVTLPDGLISVAGGPAVSVEGYFRINFIDNQGTISSTGAAGAPFASGGAGTGISLMTSSIVLGVGRDGITNSGAISGTGGNGGSDGMFAGAGGAGSGISASGSTISSITNSGAISGTGGAGASAMMGNGSGGAGSGISASGGTIGSITNSGTISGTGGSASGMMMPGIAGAGSGISASGAIIGPISNSGTISGADGTGGFLFGFQPLSGYGIKVVASSTVDSIINSGTISGGSAAIYIDSGSTVTHGITNTGVLNGAVTLNGATLNLDGTSGTVTGAVSGGAGSSVNVRGTFTSANAFNVGTFNIASTGVFNMGHGVTTLSGLNNAGTLAVAAGTTATINGDYTQAASGVFETGLNSASTYGQLVVTGTADLSASNKINVNVLGAPSLVAGTSVQPGVISASSLIAGPTFAVTDNSALFDFIGVKNGNAIDLCVASAGASTCAAPSIPDVPSTPAPPSTPDAPSAPVITVVSSVTSVQNNPALGAARVFDSLIALGTAAPAGMSPIITALGTLPTEQAVSDAVKQTLPLMAAGMTGVSSAALHATNRVIQSRQEANKGLSSGDEFVLDRQVWFKPVGSWAKQDDRNGVSGYKADSYGMVVGSDRVISERLRAGAALSYMHSKVEGNSVVAMQQAKVDGLRLIAYGSYSLDPRTDLSFQGDIGASRNDGQRTINFGGLNSVAESNYDSLNAHVGAALGRTIELAAKTSLTPSLRVDYTHMRDAAYTETGAGGLNLDVARSTTKELILSIDGKLNHALNDRTTLTANLGAGYDTLAQQSSITAAFVGGGGQFTTKGLAPSPWLYRAGLGVLVTNSLAMEITARYDAEAREGFINHTASVKVRMPF